MKRFERQQEVPEQPSGNLGLVDKLPFRPHGRWLAAAILIGGFLLQWALLMNIAGPTWDATFYYAYGRSLLFDQDLSLVNDLLLSYPTASPDFVARALHTNLTQTGSVYAPFAIGSGFLWLPLMATIRLAATIIGLPASTGFEWYFLAPVATLSALAGLLAFYGAYRLAQHEAGRQAALWATVTISFASPLIYYQFREPLYAHVPSALFNTLFVVFWWRTYLRIPSTREGLLTGFLLALTTLMRWQNAIYILLPVMSSTWAWLRQSRDAHKNNASSLPLFLAATAGAFLLVFSIQFYVWHVHYGSWLTIPQGESFMTWQSPYLRELLFSPFRGLLPWMPVAILAFIGLVGKVRRNPRLIVPLLVLLIASTYVNASSRDWFAGGGYGPRRSAGELAIFVLGYAYLLRALPRRWRQIGGLFAAMLLSLHQWLLLRYALAEHIGGGVLSMAPTFEWSEVGYPEFIRQLGGHIPDLFRRPQDVFVFPGSPMHQLLLTHALPARHLFSLFAAGIFVVACLFAGRFLVRRRTSFLGPFFKKREAAQT